MKVTALLPDQLINDLNDIAKGKNLTESLTIALKEWVSMKKLLKLNKKVQKQPLEFVEGFSASKIRTLNRKR